MSSYLADPAMSGVWLEQYQPASNNMGGGVGGPPLLSSATYYHHQQQPHGGGVVRSLAGQYDQGFPGGSCRDQPHLQLQQFQQPAYQQQQLLLHHHQQQQGSGLLYWKQQQCMLMGRQAQMPGTVPAGCGTVGSVSACGMTAVSGSGPGVSPECGSIAPEAGTSGVEWSSSLPVPNAGFASANLHSSVAGDSTFVTGPGPICNTSTTTAFLPTPVSSQPLGPGVCSPVALSQQISTGPHCERTASACELDDGVASGVSGGDLERVDSVDSVSAAACGSGVAQCGSAACCYDQRSSSVGTASDNLEPSSVLSDLTLNTDWPSTAPHNSSGSSSGSSSCDSGVDSPPRQMVAVSSAEAAVAPPVGNSVVAPLRWNRVTSNGVVVYISPSGVTMTSVDEAREYLLSPGTCKCGLECPINVHQVFNFDPKVITRPWSRCGPDPPNSAASKMCNHRRKSDDCRTPTNTTRKDVLPTFQEQRCNPHNNPFFKEQMMQAMVMGGSSTVRHQVTHHRPMLSSHHHHHLSHHHQHHQQLEDSNQQGQLGDNDTNSPLPHGNSSKQHGENLEQPELKEPDHHEGQQEQFIHHHQQQQQEQYGEGGEVCLSSEFEKVLTSAQSRHHSVSSDHSQFNYTVSAPIFKDSSERFVFQHDSSSANHRQSLIHGPPEEGSVGSVNNPASTSEHPTSVLSTTSRTSTAVVDSSMGSDFSDRHTGVNACSQTLSNAVSPCAGSQTLLRVVSPSSSSQTLMNEMSPSPSSRTLSKVVSPSGGSQTLSSVVSSSTGCQTLSSAVPSTGSQSFSSLASPSISSQTLSRLASSSSASQTWSRRVSPSAGSQTLSTSASSAGSLSLPTSTSVGSQVLSVLTVYDKVGSEASKGSITTPVPVSVADVPVVKSERTLSVSKSSSASRPAVTTVLSASTRTVSSPAPARTSDSSAESRAMPSFLDDPSGYLLQQTHLLNNTLSHERLSPAPAVAAAAASETGCSCQQCHSSAATARHHADELVQSGTTKVSVGTSSAQSTSVSPVASIKTEPEDSADVSNASRAGSGVLATVVTSTPAAAVAVSAVGATAAVKTVAARVTQTTVVKHRAGANNSGRFGASSGQRLSAASTVHDAQTGRRVQQQQRRSLVGRSVSVRVGGAGATVKPPSTSLAQSGVVRADTKHNTGGAPAVPTLVSASPAATVTTTTVAATTKPAKVMVPKATPASIQASTTPSLAPTARQSKQSCHTTTGSGPGGPARRAAPPALAPAPPQPLAPTTLAAPGAQFQMFGAGTELPLLLPSGQLLLAAPTIQPFVQYTHQAAAPPLPQQQQWLLSAGGTLFQAHTAAPVVNTAAPPDPPAGGSKRKRRRIQASATNSTAANTVQSRHIPQHAPLAAPTGLMPTLVLSSPAAAAPPAPATTAQPGLNLLQPLFWPAAAPGGGQLLIQTVGGQLISAPAGPQSAPGSTGQLLQLLPSAPTLTFAPAAQPELPSPCTAAADSSTAPAGQGSPGVGSLEPAGVPVAGCELVTSTVCTPDVLEQGDGVTSLAAPLADAAQQLRTAGKRTRPLNNGAPLDVGDLVWGCNQGVDSWPGRIIDRSDMPVTPSDHVWVCWFGDHTMSLLPKAKLRRFQSPGVPAKQKKHSVLNTSFEEAVQEAMTAVGASQT